MSHFGTDTKVTYGFDPVCDWYTKYVVYHKNNEKYVKKTFLTYYNSSTSIPKVGRKHDNI